MEFYRTHGKNWKMIAKEMRNRTGKQIRDRFLNSLNPDLNKKKFGPREDRDLVSLYNKFGPAWLRISTYFKGRSGDMIKNRFFSIMRKNMIPVGTRLKFKKRILINGDNNTESSKSRKAAERARKAEKNKALRSIKKSILGISHAEVNFSLENGKNLDKIYMEYLADGVKDEIKNILEKGKNSEFAISDKKIENKKIIIN
jgi:hypothetical protein